MVCIFFIILGFMLTLSGTTYIIAYLNLLNIGYNLSEYVNFITRRIECWNLVLGLIILIFSIYISGKGETSELRI